MAHENIYGPGNNNYGRDKMGLSETEKKQIMAHEKERELLEKFSSYLDYNTRHAGTEYWINNFLSTLPEEKEEIDRNCLFCIHFKIPKKEEPCSSCSIGRKNNFNSSK